MSRSLWLVGGLLLTAPMLAVAQTPAERLERQDREIVKLTATRDSLTVLWRAARGLAALQDSLAHVTSVGRLDTIAVGSLRIVTNPSDLPLREAATRVWPMLDSLYGVDARELEAFPVLLQAVRPDTTPPLRDTWAMTIPSNMPVDELVGLLRGMARIGRMDSSLQRWISRPIGLPTGSLAREASDVYVALVASAYDVGRECFAGNLRSCRAALRLDDADDSLLLAAYTSSRERREIILGLEQFFRRRHNLEGFLVRCRAGSDAACDELLKTVPSAQLPQPLDLRARLLLVHLAIQLGGRQGYHRLMATPDVPMSQRVSHAAGVSLDSLLIVWRSTLLAARPAPVTVPFSGVLLGLGWVTLLGLCGLRSSRWRFG